MDYEKITKYLQGKHDKYVEQEKAASVAGDSATAKVALNRAKSCKEVIDMLKEESFVLPEEQLIKKKIEAQKQYCAKTKSPHFAPSSGCCFKCGRQIYKSISMEAASKSLVTGCPFCHKSYCD